MAAAIERCYLEACALDVSAIKPGNVRAGSPAHRMTAGDFLLSARVSAPGLCAPGARVGLRIWRAVEATRRAVTCNTNLGIALLAAPLCRAADVGAGGRAGALRALVERELAALDLEDAEYTYRAIRLASPGGLGTAPRHDVRDAPTVTLLEAMREAASRDAIARQYAEGYRDVFEIGVPAWQSGLERFGDEPAAASWTFLSFLAVVPDSHIERKLGRDTAQAVASEAQGWMHDLTQSGDGGRTVALLERWDLSFKTRGLNPGTSADLTVASVLAAKLAHWATL